MSGMTADSPADDSHAEDPFPPPPPVDEGTALREEPPVGSEIGEYPLGEEMVDPETVAGQERAARMLAEARARLDAKPETDRYERISLMDLLKLVVFASVLLAASRYFSPGAFAGTCGLAALLWLAIAAFVGVHSYRLELAWCVLLAVYIVAMFMAVYQTAS